MFVCETGYLFHLSPSINLLFRFIVMSTIANLQKKIGVVRASITPLGARLGELEETSDQPHLANQLLTKLKSLDNFKKLHFDTLLT